MKRFLFAGLLLTVLTLFSCSRKKDQTTADQSTQTAQSDDMLLASRDELPATEELSDLIRCFQMDAPLGVVGDTILSARFEKNEIFRVKHGFPTFTLEDEILLALLDAIQESKKAEVRVQNNRHMETEGQRKRGYPIQIFVSQRSGRRFVCLYMESKRSAHFECVRLDQIKEVTILPDTDSNSAEHRQQLEAARESVWGVSFAPLVPGKGSLQKLILTIHADERTEPYIVKRLQREGEGGSVERIAPDTFRFEKTVKDAMEMFPWIRSFTGRIAEMEIYDTDGEQLLGRNARLERIFFSDLEKMYQKYGIEI